MLSRLKVTWKFESEVEIMFCFSLSNNFNNLAVSQNMKRGFKFISFMGDATMIALHKHNQS